MDFWASLEHQLKYKHHVENEADIVKQLKECADLISTTDYRMLSIRQNIEKHSSAPSEEEAAAKTQKTGHAAYLTYIGAQGLTHASRSLAQLTQKIKHALSQPAGI